MKKILRRVLSLGLSLALLASPISIASAKTTNAVKEASASAVSWDFTKQEDYDQWKKLSGGGIVTKTAEGMDVKANGAPTFLSPDNSPVFQNGYMEFVMKSYPMVAGEGRIGAQMRFQAKTDGTPLNSAAINYDPSGARIWGWGTWVNGSESWSGNGNSYPDFTGGSLLDSSKYYRIRVELTGSHVKILMGEEGASALTTIVNQDGPPIYPANVGKIALRFWGYEGHYSRATIKSLTAGPLNPVTLNPSSKAVSYQDAGSSDITIQMTPSIAGQSNPLASVAVNGTALSEGTDYTKTDSTFTIKKEYVAKVKDNGTTQIVLTFADGSTSVFDLQVTPPPAVEKTYTIDFSKETDLSKVTVGQGSARLEGGALVSDVGTTTQVSINPTAEFPVFQNGEFTVVMEPLDDRNGEFGIQLRDAGSNWGVFVGVDEPGTEWGTTWKVKAYGSGTTNLLSRASRVYAKRAPYTIKARTIGNVLTLFVDGVEIGQTTVSGSGSAGKCSIKSAGRGFKVHSVTMSTLNAPEINTSTASVNTIASDAMTVSLDTDFPRVAGYILKDGTAVDGQPIAYQVLEVNNMQFVNPSVTSEFAADHATYTITAGDYTFKVRFTVEGNVLTMSFPELPSSIKSINFPKHSLVSMKSTEGATLTRQTYQQANKTQTALSSAAASASFAETSIAVLSNGKAAATIFADSMKGNREIAYQTQALTTGTTTGLWSNEIHFRGFLDGEKLFNEEKYPDGPTVRVAVTGDRNSDATADYQDGAIAYRDDLAIVPVGSDLLRDSYSSIAMNVGSGAQYPFLRILDNIKKVYLGTDGFGQNVLIKGYQTEGHDSSHPDFAAINQRAGGVEDFQKLLSESQKYNANVGVHINHTETYPEAPQYANIASGVGGWTWYDHANQLIREKDLLSGDTYARLDKLAEIAQGNLKMVYVDVYSDRDWAAYKLMSKLNNLGWAAAGEYQGFFPQQCVWVHNPTTEAGGYADESLIRMVDSQNREVFRFSNLYRGVRNPGTRVNGINGWQESSDYYDTIKDFYTNVLPNKYLMNFPVQKMETNKATLGKDNSITTQWDGSKNIIKKDGKTIASGNEIFIPWDPSTEEKIYCYSASGTSSAWQLPDSWQDVTSATLYKLSDEGRDAGTQIAVNNHSVTLTLQSGTGYVLCKETTAAPLSIGQMNWSDGSVIKDMGFDSHTFGANGWSVQKGTVSFADTSKGNTGIKFASNVEGAVSQTMTGLVAGKAYSASVWVDVPVNGRRGTITVSQNDGTSVSNYAQDQIGQCMLSHSDKIRTTQQRVKLEFVAKAETAVITLSAASGPGDLYFDDVRVSQTFSGKLTDYKGHTFYEDFENVDQGYGPFESYLVGTFAKFDNTHLSQLNPGVTDDVLDGNYSLKVCADGGGQGNSLRTLPHRVRFAANTTYTIGFEFKPYGCSNPLVLQVKAADGSTILSQNVTGAGEKSFTFTTGNTDDCYVQLSQSGAGPNRGYILDNFYADRQDNAAPTAPSNVVANSITDTSAAISWTASTDDVGVVKYEVYRSVNGADEATPLATVTEKLDEAVITAALTGLTADTEYILHVYAYDLAGHKSAAGTVTFTTSGTPAAVDKSTLKVVLDLADVHVKNGDVDKLIPAAKEKFNAVLKAAQDVYADEAATEAQVDKAWKDLMLAIQGLGFVQGDKTELGKLIAAAKELDLNLYEDGAEKTAFTAALTKAEEVFGDANALPSDVKEANDKLDAAIKALKPKPVVGDKKELRKAIETAESYDLTEYVSDANKTNFEKVLAEAKDFYDNNDKATQGEIDQMRLTLITAMNNLRLRADKATLNDWLDKFKALDLSKYSAADAAAVRAMIAEGEAMEAQDLGIDEAKLIEELTARMEALYTTIQPSEPDPEPSKPDSKPEEGSSSETPDEPDSSSTSSGSSSTGSGSKTGDSTPIAAVSLLAVAAAGALVILKKRKG